MNYEGEARRIADQFSHMDLDIDAAKVYALLAITEHLATIAQELSRMNDARSEWGDIGVEKIEEERDEDGWGAIEHDLPY